MKYSFHPEAKTEFIESVRYYEDCQEGLGLDFSAEIFATIQKIIHFPNAWAKLPTNTSRCLPNRFPFGYEVSINPHLVVSCILIIH